MIGKLIPQEVKNKVYEVTQDVFEQYGKVETERVRAGLEEDFGICFFNTIELEKLIKEGLDKQIFAYKKPVEKNIEVTAPKKRGFIIQCKTRDLTKEDIEQAIESAREQMNISIDKNGRESDETIELSQKLDILIVTSMRNSL